MLFIVISNLNGKKGDVEDNDFKPIVDRILHSKQSIVINGKAGCGKSKLINMMQTEMTEQGIQFISLAPTNKACRVINGTTLHKYTPPH